MEWEGNQLVLAKAIRAAAKAAKPADPGDEKTAADKLTNTDEIMAILQVMIGSIRENPNILMLLKDYRRKLNEPCVHSAPESIGLGYKREMRGYAPVGGLAHLLLPTYGSEQGHATPSESS